MPSSGKGRAIAGGANPANVARTDAPLVVTGRRGVGVPGAIKPSRIRPVNAAVAWDSAPGGARVGQHSRNLAAMILEEVPEQVRCVEWAQQVLRGRRLGLAGGHECAVVAVLGRYDLAAPGRRRSQPYREHHRFAA